MNAYWASAQSDSINSVKQKEWFWSIWQSTRPQELYFASFFPVRSQADILDNHDKTIFLSTFKRYPSSLYVEKAMATHFSPLAWKIPWMEEPGGLQSMGSLRVRHEWANSLSLFTFMHWRRKWQPTPGFLPGESQGWEPGGLTSMGLHRVRHDWSDLAAAAAASLYDCSPQSTHHVISLLSSAVIAPVVKSRDCTVIAFASKAISKYWVCFNKVCSGERANPRQPLSIFHYYMVRMTQQANLGKALKREDEGGGLAHNLQLEKAFKYEKCTSLKLLPDPL